MTPARILKAGKVTPRPGCPPTGPFMVHDWHFDDLPPGTPEYCRIFGVEYLCGYTVPQLLEISRRPSEFEMPYPAAADSPPEDPDAFDPNEGEDWKNQS